MLGTLLVLWCALSVFYVTTGTIDDDKWNAMAKLTQHLVLLFSVPGLLILFIPFHIWQLRKKIHSDAPAKPSGRSYESVEALMKGEGVAKEIQQKVRDLK